MTRKDYILIADELRRMPNAYITDNVLDALCSAFKRDNPKFDSRRFRDYVRSER